MEAEHAEIQAELQAVKKALRADEVYLGMKGETLQRYLLQLNEKENLLLSHKLRNLGGGAAAPEAQAGGLLSTSTAGPVTPTSAPPVAAASATNGYAAVAPAAPAPVATPAAAPAAAAVGAPTPAAVEARPPPEGPVRALDRDNLESVLKHFSDYESSALETVKCLRAISSLAYADAAGVGTDRRVLEQVLRVLAIYPKDDAVQLASMRAFCNMAYAPNVALDVLSASHGVFLSLMSAMARDTGSKDIGAKAREAVARIVAAEVNPNGVEAEPAKSPVQALPEGQGPLCGLFGAAITGGSSWHSLALQLVLELITNEVVLPTLVARRFVATYCLARRDTVSSCGWLGLGKMLASSTDCPELAGAMVDCGAIREATALMAAHEADGSVQLAGIEGLSSFVGNRFSGLQAFADVKGMQRIEAAMRKHLEDGVLQTKGIRALASGIQWPNDMQEKSAYDWKASVELTKAAMSHHGGNSELQVAALEALAKYLDRLQCVAEVKNGGGEGLVKAMMIRHTAVQKVQTWGKVVLDSLGVDRGWQPRGAAGGAA
eukprot:TRINITY_DN111067_c0_g1_i1.p1 TRINITY_DN111067_c0_g1~~TRINITY_DN111067_c0_g1_i1.p1  ORF type:complete len:547 (-),score=152.76 TRINITY_DN111067_c0_g1_i1:149-1789(-)